MRTLVLLQIYNDLLHKSKITRVALSEKYELSTRTISRYIDILASSGVPILSHTGVDGGYALPQDYKIERHSFNQAEWNRIIDALKKTATEFGDDINFNILEAIEYNN